MKQDIQKVNLLKTKSNRYFYGILCFLFKKSFEEKLFLSRHLVPITADHFPVTLPERLPL